MGRGRFGLPLLVCLLLGACGQRDNRSLDVQHLAGTSTATSHPISVTARTGKVSIDPVAVLAKKDHRYWKDFTPSTSGLIADIVFPAPAGVGADGGVTIQVNFLGAERAQQRWQLDLYDTRLNQWVYLGDNAAARAGKWTMLTFAATGQLGDYLKSGVVTLRYSTTGGSMSSLDYASLVVSGVGGITVPVPTATATPTKTPTPGKTPTPVVTPVPGVLPGTGRIPAGRLHGLTLDSVDDMSGILTTLSKMAKRPTVRIVFDENVPATEYRDAANRIYNAGYVMGEILDSFYMKDISLAGYRARVTEYLDTLADKVDIWEIGNEINGEWLGGTADTVAKMSAAYDLVKARGGVTELTLYYNEDCWEKPQNEMFTWAQANVPTRMKQGLDYVLVSYYEDDCNGLQPNWPAAFRRLAQMFPNSRIGMGEVGTQTASKKVSYINRYYSMELPAEPHFIGGFFWWYGRQDFVPSSSTYFRAFNEMIRLH